MLRDWLLGIPYLYVVGYIIAFFAAFLETLPAVGLFVPGQAIVVLLGFAAQQKLIHLPALLALVIIGAILGDLLGFILGRKYGIALFAKQKGIIKDIATILRGHPFKTLVLGRFNSITRAFAPFAAGSSKLDWRKFLPANIIGGVLWGVTWIMIGYVLGTSYDVAQAAVDTIFLVTGITLSVILTCYYYLKRHTVVRNRTRRLLAMNITALIFFSMIAYSVVHAGVITGLDTLASIVVKNIRVQPVTIFMQIITNLGSVVALMLLTIIASIFLYFKKQYRDSILLIITMLSGLVVNVLLKATIARARPAEALLFVDSYAFPSGHAFLTTVMVAALVMTVVPFMNLKKYFVVTCVILASIICISRVYLGVHYASDVLGGIFLGIFWMSFVFLLAEAYESYNTDQTKIIQNARSGR